MRMIFLDFETQSTIDLREVGSSKYVNHPDTEMLSLVYKCNGKIVVWLNRQTSPDYVINKHNFKHNLLTPDILSNVIIVRTNEVPWELTAFTNDHILCAHNATFDKLCWEKFVSKESVRWFDTLPCARAGGYPGELEKLSMILTGYGKDAGSHAMKMLTNIKIKNGKKQRPVGTKVLWEQLIQYNIIDVILLEMIYEQVKNYGEPDVIELDRKINERGVYIDKRLVVNLYKAYTYNEVKSKDEWDVITGDINPRSPKQIKDWLASKGYNVGSLNKQVLEHFFNNPEDYVFGETQADELDSITEALRLRQQIVRAGRGKVERIAMLLELEDSTITNQLVYYGAHTGRWTGRGLQPHNFARGRSYIDIEKLVKYKELTLPRLIKEAEAANVIAVGKGEMPMTVSDVLGTLARSCIRARPGRTFGILDYGQIECRVTAELAEEQLLLDQFAGGYDPYKYMASKVFGIKIEQVTKEQRQIGKIIILACGYGMSAGKFDANCRIIYNINLEAAGTSAIDCVNSYRDTYKKIAGNPRQRQGIWQRYNDAAHNCINFGIVEKVGAVWFEYKDNTLCITLPSGRPMYYRNCSIQDRIPGYCKTLNLEPFVIPTIVYTHPHGYEGTLYGGLITENIAQGFARDIIAQHMIDLDEAGFDIPLHVHDEVVAELKKPKHLYTMCKIMSTAPKWCPNLPILVEGFTCDWYSKSPFKSSLRAEYLNGKEKK